MPISTQVTLKQLRYFARVVELGSISRASLDLHVAQTALGLQVRALEECLGVTLLLRHPKGVQPTDIGKVVYEKSQQVLGAVDLMVSEIEMRSETKSRDIWIGLAPSFMAAIGTQAILAQSEKIPGVLLHLYEGSRQALLDDVRTGDLNWAISHEVVDAEGLVSVPILRQSLAMVTRPGEGCASEEVPLREVLKRELVLDSGRLVVSDLVTTAAERLGITPAVRYQVDSARAIKEIIRSEGMAGIFIRSLVQDELKRGELEACSIVEPTLEMTAYFVHSSRTPPSEHDLPILEFLDALLDAHVAANPTGQVRLERIASVVSGTSGDSRSETPVRKVTSG